MRITGSLIVYACILMGCTGYSTAPGTEDALAQERLWPVLCESSLKPRLAPGKDPKTSVAKGWVKALTPSGYEIEVHGRLEDGFVQVTRVVSADIEWSLDTKTPYLQLRKVCRRTLADRMNGELYRPGLVRTRNPDTGVFTSFVFDDWSDRKDITRLIVFGDSLSDTGSLKRRLKVVPRKPYWVGRFSNGPVWTDYLEVSAGLALQNHARGGAMLASREQMDNEELVQRVYTNGQFFVSGDINDQVESFATNYLKERQLQRSDRSVAVLWAGANDYISKEAFDTSISALLGQPFSKEGYLELVTRVVDALELNLIHLRELGLARFMVITLPDLGLAPMVIHNDSFLASKDFASNDERLLEFSQRLSELTTWHNKALADMVDNFRSDYSDVEIVLADANELFNEVFDPAMGGTEMGFDLQSRQVTIALNGTDAVLQDHCYTGIAMGLLAVSSSVCQAAPRTVFWDLVHPTTYFHCWTAHWIGNKAHDQGWMARMPDVESYREWCVMIADAY